jgi:hypothetical protein
MSALLADALKQLDLKPGESRCVAVDDYEVEIRRPKLVVEDSGPMVNIWLDVPPSENARTVALTRGEAEFPKPLEIHESDLAPE